MLRGAAGVQGGDKSGGAQERRVSRWSIDTIFLPCVILHHHHNIAKQQIIKNGLLVPRLNNTRPAATRKTEGYPLIIANDTKKIWAVSIFGRWGVSSPPDDHHAGTWYTYPNLPGNIIVAYTVVARGPTTVIMFGVNTKMMEHVQWVGAAVKYLHALSIQYFPRKWAPAM